MIYTHLLKEIDLELGSSIARHSGDETLTYKAVEGKPISLSMYYPSKYDAKCRYSTIFFIHGGGWSSHKVFDDQEEWAGDHLGYLARYYADKGYIGVSIDYRLLQDMGQKKKFQLTDLYEDCKDALDYVLDRADVYGIDMDKVYLLGESAGGHLAGLLATKYSRDHFQFKTAFLINPLTDLVGDENWGMRVPNGVEQGTCAKELSPSYNVDEYTCPIVLAHGQQDVIVNPAHSQAFYDRMCELGRQCELHYIEETSHAFLLAEHTKNITACKIGISILDHALRQNI